MSDNPDKEFKTLKELCGLAEKTYNAGGRPRDSVAVAQMLELIKANPLRLTDEGQRIAVARHERQVELIHFLMYTGWDAATPSKNAPLWTYREVCNLLWEREHSLIEAKQIAGELTGKLYKDEVFGKNSNFDLSKLSFSDKTVRGVLIWLEQLHPPAVQRTRGKREFARRTTCSRELLLLGIGWVYRDAVGEPHADGLLDSADLPLTRDRREALCRLCLLDPAHLERMLNAVISTYPGYISEGTATGFSRFLRLYRIPRIEDAELLI